MDFRLTTHKLTDFVPGVDGLPRRCAPRNDGILGTCVVHKTFTPKSPAEAQNTSRHTPPYNVIASEARQSICEWHFVINSVPYIHRLPRRCAPRNDGTHSKSAGFTLLEVLIALSIFAIMGLASYHLLSSEARTQQVLAGQSEKHNHWQRGMMRLTQDLQQAVERSVREDYGTRKPALVGDGESLTFTHQGWSNPLHQSRSELQRVDYRITTSPDNTPYLQRSFWFALDRAPASEPVVQTLLPDTEQLQLRYYHPEKKVWLQQWPPLEEPNIGLPQAIEVVLTSREYGQVLRLISLKIRRESPP